MNNTPEKKVEWSRGKAVKSVVLFALHLIVLLGLIALVLVWQKGWEVFQATFVENRANYLYIIFCTVLLVWIMYLYFFFENRSLLSEGKTISLVFTVLDVSFLLAVIFGRYVSIYARPFALLALLCFMLVGRKDAVFINVVFW